MSSNRARPRLALVVLALLALVCPGLLTACREPERPLLPRSQTWAELRTVRRDVTVAPPGEPERPPYPRERLVDGEVVRVQQAGLAWLRRDGGATLLVRGPAELVLHADVIDIKHGRVFVDTPATITTELATPTGPLHLAQVRASIDVAQKDGATDVYVLAGEVRTDGSARATAGERLTLEPHKGEPTAKTSPVLTWEDWTGGLATTDRSAEPSPYGVGTVGARRPGEQGAPRFPLAIQRLDVRVSIQEDFAITEVDEVFFNPSSATVEGVYRFRTPAGATLHKFGVDRDGVVFWGYVKEKQAAAAQYQANVYEGSKEDPALLEWEAPGVYKARLYPILPGQSRRVVVRYAEWLGRTGARGERRLYVYPMAAEGAEGSLPHIEELTATIDLARAGAREVRTGMSGAREGGTISVRAQDFVPRADLAIELFDDGLVAPRGYTAPHTMDPETVPPSERADAMQRAKTEADYVIVPIRSADVPLAKGGLDLAIVIDTSAATDSPSLAIARATTAALLAHLGKDDRVGVFGGDTSLVPVVPGKEGLAPIDEAGRREVLARMSRIERGGATDLGAMLSQAAALLDPSRRGAVVYVGDGAPTVGELRLQELRDRMAKLPRPVRMFGVGVGDEADMALLEGLARGGFAERVADANAAARVALRLLEHAERPVWLGAQVDLGPTVERIFPRDLGALVADESIAVIGRVTSSGLPTSVSLTGPSGTVKTNLQVTRLEDEGDLRRRWAEGRLLQMMAEATGRAAMVDLGSRHAIITPVTSLYVPTKNEMTPEERAELERKKGMARSLVETKRRMGWTPIIKTDVDQEAEESEDVGPAEVAAAPNADNKEGGTGTRAKGEEGSMGNPNTRITGNRYGVQGPADNADPHIARQAALRDAAEFGMIGMLNTGAGGDPNAPTAPWGRDDSLGNGPTSATGNQWGNTIGDAYGAGGLGISGIGEGGGGRGEGIGLGSIGTIGNGAGTGTGQGFGSGHGRLGGAHASAPPKIMEAPIAMPSAAATASPAAPPPPPQAAPRPLGGVTKSSPPGDPLSGGDLDGKPSAGEGYYKFEETRQVLEKALKNEAAKPDAAKKAAGGGGARSSGISFVVQVGDVPHQASPCSGAALVPFEERVGLWRERFGRVAGNAQGVRSVYRTALSACEAPTWRERSKLVSLMLDAMPSIAAKVSLWRAMFTDLGVADSLYRGILARVRTAQEMRELHAALGLKSMDPGLLEKLIKDTKSPDERVKKLRELVAQWPDDFALALRLLDMLEDASDDAGARELGRTLRSRPDADARVRTAVGELYMRLAAKESDAGKKAAYEAEARRSFGEIVEFAPDDPVARRRLGDLLRAHGWYADAARQYETLARLAPDDTSVSLLLAAAAEGTGKLEEAIKWTEKGGAAGAPDAEQSPAVTARAFAATYLAWGRLLAQKNGKKDEEQTLRARLLRVISTERAAGKGPRGARVSLTWSHPEFHPSLWTNGLGTQMPAPEGDVTLGIAQALLPMRPDARVEVRLEGEDVEHAARLGAEAILTIVFDEGEDGETIVKQSIRFARGGKPVRAFAISKGEAREVEP
ncbi:VIT domain-containing protein [Polyangium sp. 6x1]|uniref:VIT domain-containing protein n=1 Tax=Polyangium sp. 6x1 TaxID=3042689 RepID=UPI0024821D92|nr:VIT domain-containing protein [Polyangium sp. 6x1]MDI1448666.1 VIT domain-containing protein [Polyangium sp. 6x1]